MPPAIEVRNVSKRFRLRDEPLHTFKDRALRLGRRAPTRDFWALSDVSVEVGEGETLGLIGHNGSGKSTLLKCIGGILQPTEGQVVTRGRLASLLELGAGFNHELSGRENVYLNGSILGLSRREIDRRFDAMVDFADLGDFIDNPVKTYSSGMFIRLGFAVAVNVEPDILLIDEVLAVGDEAFQARCLDRIATMQREGRTIVFVTHGVEIVRQLCDDAAVLNAGRIVAHGDPGECIRRFRDTLLNRNSWYDEAAQPGEPAIARVHAARGLTTQQVRILDLEVEAATDPVEPGAAVSVHVDYETAARVDDVVCAFALFDPEGRVLHGTNSSQLGLELAPLEGRGRLRFHLPALPLRDGRYTVSIGFHSAEGDVVHDFSEAAVEVAHRGHQAGLLHLDLQLDAAEPSRPGGARG